MLEQMEQMDKMQKMMDNEELLDKAIHEVIESSFIYLFCLSLSLSLEQMDMMQKMENEDLLDKAINEVNFNCLSVSLWSRWTMRIFC